MSEHALLAPSAAHRWRHCPGSVLLQQAYPDGEGIAAQEGTVAHWVAMCIAVAGRAPAVGSLCPYGGTVDDEMIEAAEVYVDTLRKLAGPHWNTPAVVLERRVEIPRIHRSHCFGTPDARIWLPGWVLHVVDFKYGHRVVEPHENDQLVAYAAGVMAEAGREVSDEQITLVFTIVQPRAPHPDGIVRSWTCKGSDIRGQINMLQMSADAALVTDAPTKAGPWCRDCSARMPCETIQRAALGIADEVRDALAFDPTPHAVGVELRYLERAKEVLDARISGLQAQAEAMLKNGQPVPFWRIEQVPGRETWTVPPEQVVALGEAMQIPLGKPAVVTPNQARKAGIPAEVVAAMADRPKSALKLTPDDGSKARKIFGAAP